MEPKLSINKPKKFSLECQQKFSLRMVIFLCISIRLVDFTYIAHQRKIIFILSRYMYISNRDGTAHNIFLPRVLLTVVNSHYYNFP